MSKSLLIVESPAKARTLKRYLGKDFQVHASVGHLKDLPKNELGVDPERGFEPKYGVIRGKGKIVQQLKKAAKEADAIYLAPDPDREGEAIAWHIAEEVVPKRGNKEVYRVLIHEITKKGLMEAISKPRSLDRNLYNSQQARRILDRLVGYKISPILWDKVRRGLSAGRVQSVALRLVVDREREIKAFESTEYWKLEATLKGSSLPLVAAGLHKINGKQAKIENEAQAEKARKESLEQPFKLEKIEKKEKRKNPSPPFITSSIQREAFRKFRFSAKKTMMLAQRLYEGVDVDGQPVGLITYMRTDSTRLSADAVEACRNYIDSTFGKNYLPPKPVFYKAKKGAQDAHEAIRPTSMEYSPDKVRSSLDADQLKLYKLIWDRFVSCQMCPALFDQTSFTINSGRYQYRASGSILKFKGFMAAYIEGVDEAQTQSEDEENEGKILPDLKEGETLEPIELKTSQHFTQPPARFTESTLVKELEDKGIGRPSTYAQILSTIRDKEYARMEERKFVPTDLGIIVNDLLVKNFPQVMDVGFTAQMESELDHVEDGKREWQDLLKNFYGPFALTVETASREMENVKVREEPTDIECDQCGKNMVIRWGRNGFFLACSSYPDCKNTKEFTRNPDGSIAVAQSETLGEKCPECGAELVIKNGRYGRFIACTNYPDCKHTSPVGTGAKCPKDGCNGELVEKRSKRGRVFYSCNRYPDCNYAVWDFPFQRDCPLCGHKILVQKKGQDENSLSCPQRGCKYKGSGA